MSKNSIIKFYLLVLHEKILANKKVIFNSFISTIFITFVWLEVQHHPVYQS